MLEYTVVGKICRLDGPIANAMVEYGMSRFKKERAHTKAQTDKPTTILTLVTFVEREKLTEILDTCSQLVKCSLLWHWHCI